MVKGKDTSTGYISWANRTIAAADALIVRNLREAGAIIYVKTANPQSLLVCSIIATCAWSISRANFPLSSPLRPTTMYLVA
jgi:hypothetical protein